MAALTLAQIRAKLTAQDQKSSGNNNSSYGTGEVFAHWSMEEGSTARLRFLPDANPSNSFFWVEKAMIKLPFAGIKGDSNSKPVIVQVPCIEMFAGYENKCPILAEVRTWFKDKGLEEMGRKYWKKKSYLFQGFVRENPMNEDKVPENPIRRFIISPQIFNLVKGALMDPELENLPTDYESGLDFTVLKTAKGGYADYSTSKWARKESALTVDEAEAIEKYGLFNLKDSLPKFPTQEEQDIMVEMFHASVDGQAYDADKWSKYFKPAGFQTANTTADADVADAPVVTKPAAKAAPAPTVDEDEEVSEPVVTAKATPAAAAAGGGSRAEDILALIRNRQKASA